MHICNSFYRDHSNLDLSNRGKSRLQEEYAHCGVMQTLFLRDFGKHRNCTALIDMHNSARQIIDRRISNNVLSYDKI